MADYLAGRKVNTRAPTETTLFGGQLQGAGGLFGPNTRAPTETTLFGQFQGSGLFGPRLVKPSGGIFTGGKLLLKILICNKEDFTPLYTF
jgi:hypothetical protein